MDRGAWRAAVHGVARVGQDLATNPTSAQAITITVDVYRVGQGGARQETVRGLGVLVFLDSLLLSPSHPGE